MTVAKISDAITTVFSRERRSFSRIVSEAVSGNFSPLADCASKSDTLWEGGMTRRERAVWTARLCSAIEALSSDSGRDLDPSFRASVASFAHAARLSLSLRWPEEPVLSIADSTIGQEAVRISSLPPRVAARSGLLLFRSETFLDELVTGALSSGKWRSDPVIVAKSLFHARAVDCGLLPQKLAGLSSAALVGECAGWESLSLVTGKVADLFLDPGAPVASMHCKRQGGVVASSWDREGFGPAMANREAKSRSRIRRAVLAEKGRSSAAARITSTHAAKAVAALRFHSDIDAVSCAMACAIYIRAESLAEPGFDPASAWTKFFISFPKRHSRHMAKALATRLSELFANDAKNMPRLYKAPFFRDSVEDHILYGTASRAVRAASIGLMAIEGGASQSLGPCLGG